MAEDIFERMDRLENRMADDYADTMKGFITIAEGMKRIENSMERYYANSKEAISELRKIMTGFDARLTAVERRLASG